MTNRVKMEWMERLKVISHNQWEELKLTKSFSHEIHWWNHKWDYDEMYNEEIFNRNYGRIGNGRFDLGDHPVSYWAGDYSIGLSETIPELRNEPDLKLKQIINSHREGFADYPICRKIKEYTPLLDISVLSNPFFEIIEHHGIVADANSFFQNIIVSRNTLIYPITQAISEIAYKNKFGGII